jgi:hypothetical protein
VLDITIPSAHQATYILNSNYVTTIKQYINKLLTTGFIQFVEEATWLSPIVILWQTKYLYKFQKTKCNHKERSIPITFHRWSVEHSNMVWSIFFLKWIFKISSNLYSSKGQIQYYICYRLGGFYIKGDAVWNQKWTSNIFRELLPKHLKNIWTILWRYFWMIL